MASAYFVSVEALQKAFLNPRVRPSDRVSIIDEKSLGIGSAEEPRALVFDFESEQIRSHSGNRATISSHVPTQNRAKRVSGFFTFRHHNVEIVKTTLPDMLEAVLIYLEDKAPGTLERLSQVKLRTRRIVARKAADLFDRKHLIDKSREIKGGWWIGTNNSALETRNWIRRACKLAGLDPIIDVTIGI